MFGCSHLNSILGSYQRSFLYIYGHVVLKKLSKKVKVQHKINFGRGYTAPKEKPFTNHATAKRTAGLHSHQGARKKPRSMQIRGFIYSQKRTLLYLQAY